MRAIRTQIQILKYIENDTVLNSNPSICSIQCIALNSKPSLVVFHIFIQFIYGMKTKLMENLKIFWQ